MSITPQEIHDVARLVYQLCGIVLDETKGYLIENRLGPVATAADCKNFDEMTKKAATPNGLLLRGAIVDAITTNETSFFRDASAYEALRNRVVPDLIDAKEKTPFPRRLRIWSAASSTGQEPYSIAMTLHQLIPDIHTWDVSILGTDICSTALKQASSGCYDSSELQRGIPDTLRDRYFTQSDQNWKIRDPIRSLVSFQKLNLLEPFGLMGPFDVIFCSNVAIYFSDSDRANLFERIVRVLTPNGCL